MANEKKKNKWVAAILSLLIPGLGHAYVGKWKLAALWFFCALGAGLCVVLLGVSGSFAIVIPTVLGVMAARDAWAYAKYGKSSWEQMSERAIKNWERANK